MQACDIAVSCPIVPAAMSEALLLKVARSGWGVQFVRVIPLAQFKSSTTMSTAGSQCDHAWHQKLHSYSKLRDCENERAGTSASNMNNAQKRAYKVLARREYFTQY